MSGERNVTDHYSECVESDILSEYCREHWNDDNIKIIMGNNTYIARVLNV